MGFAADIQNDGQGWAEETGSSKWTIQQGDEQIKPLEVGIINVRMLNGFALTDTDKEDFVASEFWFSLNSNKALLAAAKEAIAQFEEDDKAAGIWINPVRHLVAIKDEVVYHLILNRYSTILIKGGSDVAGMTRVNYNVSSPEAEIHAALKTFTANLLGW